MFTIASPKLAIYSVTSTILHKHLQETNKEHVHLIGLFLQFSIRTLHIDTVPLRAASLLNLRSTAFKHFCTYILHETSLFFGCLTCYDKTWYKAFTVYFLCTRYVPFLPILLRPVLAPAAASPPFLCHASRRILQGATCHPRK